MSTRVVQVFEKLLISFRYKNWFSLSKMPYYAVAKGRASGIFMTWPDCEAQVKGFSGARYKKFDSVTAAQDFISSHGGGSSNVAQPKGRQKGSSNYANNNTNLKRSYSTSNKAFTGYGNNFYNESKNSRQEPDSDADADSSQSDNLETILNKQMDDIETRLNNFTKGVDKIMKKSSSKSDKQERKTIMIEPPQPKRKRGGNDFEMDNEGYVQVYTDGACSSNGRSGARAGLGVYWGEDHGLNVSEPVSGRATNNCGEIQAATKAIKQAIQNGVTKLTINTDSQFLINSVTKWMPGKHFKECFEHLM